MAKTPMKTLRSNAAVIPLKSHDARIVSNTSTDNAEQIPQTMLIESTQRRNALKGGLLKKRNQNAITPTRAANPMKKCTKPVVAGNQLKLASTNDTAQGTKNTVSKPLTIATAIFVILKLMLACIMRLTFIRRPKFFVKNVKLSVCVA
jgi:hypothetical protein